MPIESLENRKPVVNNEYYNHLAERWYTAQDDPIALLRAEASFRNPWILRRILELAPNSNGSPKVLDVGCGGGFLSNYLAKEGLSVTGIDLSESSLAIATRKDETRTVNYIKANAYEMPFEDGSFDVITSTDFLEHVDEPKRVLREVARCLKTGGLFFFHTFNRTMLANLLAIKSLEWFVKNTPKNLHVIDYFISPQDLLDWLDELGFETIELRGIRPVIFQRPIVKILMRGIVDPAFRFTWTRSLQVSYLGIARKGRA